MTSFGKMKIEAQKLYIPKTTEFISCALPTNEIFLVDHCLIFPIILSARIWHSILLSLLAVIGTPRYLIGKVPSLYPISSRCCCWNRGLQPPQTSYDLSGLAWRSITWWKVSRAFLMICRVGKWALLKKSTSLANIKWFSFNCLHVGWYLKCGWSPAAFISLVKYSIDKTKSNRDKGSPCLRPSLQQNYLPVDH